MEDSIGEVAGYIYRYLEENGESSLTEIAEAVDEPRSRAHMALGWLAREEKLDFHDKGRGTSVTLR